MVEVVGNTFAQTQFSQNTVGSIVARGELIEPSNYVNLTIQFKDGNGNPVNCDSYPTISIVTPTGLVAMSPTSQGVTQVGVGAYAYIWQVSIDGPYGVYNDLWTGYINGFQVQQTFSFVVSHTNLPGINSDRTLKLGDDPGFNYSQAAIFNINKCLKMMKARLNSSGKAKATDANGNVTYVDCDIFSVDMLVTFLAMSLNKFNSVPYFTNFHWEQSDFFAMFAEVIAEGAAIMALASQSLIERGREFTLTDQGINFNPPTVSELLNTQFNTELAHHWDYVKMIKASMRPHAITLGIMNMNTSVLPAVKRLSMLRARRIF